MHQFICDHTDGEIVGDKPMIFLCQHFWGHIARCSARVSFILRLELASDAHISDVEIPTGV